MSLNKAIFFGFFKIPPGPPIPIPVEPTYPLTVDTQNVTHFVSGSIVTEGPLKIIEPITVFHVVSGVLYDQPITNPAEIIAMTHVVSGILFDQPITNPTAQLTVSHTVCGMLEDVTP